MIKSMKNWFKMKFHRCEGNVIAVRTGNLITGTGKIHGDITFYRCDTCGKVFATFQNAFFTKNIPNPEYVAKISGVSI